MHSVSNTQFLMLQQVGHVQPALCFKGIRNECNIYICNDVLHLLLLIYFFYFFVLFFFVALFLFLLLVRLPVYSFWCRLCTE